MAVTAHIRIENYRRFTVEHPLEFEIGAGLTAFLGPNNVGKSAALRFFYELRPVFEVLANSLEQMLSGSYGIGLRMAQTAAVFTMNTREPIQVTFTALSDFSTAGLPTGVRVPNAARFRFTRDSLVSAEVKLRPHDDWSQLRVGSEKDGLLTLAEDDGRTRPRYSVRPYRDLWRELSKTLFVGPFRNAVNVGTNQDYFDISIGQRFIQTWDSWIAGQNPDEREAAFAAVREIKEIFGLSGLLIQAGVNQDTLQVRLNDERTFSLDEVGAGLAQFIILLGNVHNKRISYLLIDEPETHLHAKLQIQLLDLLMKHVDAGIIYATHSVGLARATADRAYSIVAANDHESAVSELPSTRTLAQMLGELQYSAYEALGHRTVLLAEGPTDAGLWRELLRHYDGGRDVLVVPLGGGTHINGKPVTAQMLSDIVSLAGTVFAIIDSDRLSEGAETRPEITDFDRSCAANGVTCHVLARRTTENYFPETAVKRALGDRFAALLPFEALKEHQPGWAKAENFRIASKMERGDIPPDLDAFLQQVASAR